MVELDALTHDDPRRQWLAQVVAASDLKRRAKLVAPAMARYMNPTLRCRPGVPNIARDCGLSERTVAYALVELCSARLLRKLVKGHTGMATVYRGRLRAVAQPPAEQTRSIF